MTATTHQLWYLRLLEENKHQALESNGKVTFEEARNFQEGRCIHGQEISIQRSFDFISWKTYPAFNHNVTIKSLCIDSWCTLPWLDEEAASSNSAQDAKYSNDHASLPNAAAFVAILRNCAKFKDLHRGTRVHDDILKTGLLEKCSDALITMYAKCGALSKAKELLESHVSRDLFSWTALISGYAQQGLGKDAMDCFETMLRAGLSPDAVTFSSILKACGSLGAADKGEKIHDEVVHQGLLENDIVLGTALVDMYAKCGSLSKARQVFQKLSSRNAITWSALITGYAQQGEAEQAYTCYEQMQAEGFSPDAKTYACILKACGDLGAKDKGECIHDTISRQGLLTNDIVLGTSLVDMYAKCGVLDKAQQAFENLSYRDVTSWSALIEGYVQQGQGEQALKAFEQMLGEGVPPNEVTYTSILKACGTSGAVLKGEQIHDEIARQGLLGSNTFLDTALVDMYAKCGALAQAQKVLDELPSRNISTWCALITGYAQQGQCTQAVTCLERMQEEGLFPDTFIFSSLLNACSHGGRVHDGHFYFTLLSKKYGIKPDLEHYGCMIDLFGRAGHIDKAVGVIQEMPFSNNLEVWSVLLGACRKWGDVNVGRWAFEHAIRLDKENTAAYVLMADLYATAVMQEDAKSSEGLRMDKQGRKMLEIHV